MKTVQEWINKFNKEFGLDIWVDDVNNDVNNDEGTAKLDIETSTGIIIGEIELRRSEGIWRFSAIVAPFGGESWNKLTSI